VLMVYWILVDRDNRTMLAYYEIMLLVIAHVMRAIRPYTVILNLP
jgi:hypothetical protein